MHNVRLNYTFFMPLVFTESTQFIINVSKVSNTASTLGVVRTYNTGTRNPDYFFIFRLLNFVTSYECHGK